MDKEHELKAREEALELREMELERREKQLSSFSNAVREKKEEWYDHVKLSTRQLTIIIRVVYALLGLVAVLIVLEAVGIFKL